MSKHTFRSIQLALVAFVASAFFSVDAAPPAAPGDDPSQPSIRVTYLVYSGRPNPTVILTPSADYDRVAAGLQYARSTGARAAPASMQPMLGYNGVLIERFDKGALTSSVIVKGHHLDDRGTVTTSASTGDLEAAALAIGRARGALNAQAMTLIEQSRRR